jgi:hypothetical protein
VPSTCCRMSAWGAEELDQVAGDGAGQVAGGVAFQAARRSASLLMLRVLARAGLCPIRTS